MAVEWCFERASVGSVDIHRKGLSNAGGAAVGFTRAGEIYVFSEISENNIEDLANAIGITPGELCNRVRKALKGKFR